MNRPPAFALPSCPLTIVGEDDWCTIERAAHSNTYGLAPTSEPGWFQGTYSGRISDADVEGEPDEMLAIAKAIRERSQVAFKRCAVSVENGIVHFRSPRNSRRDGVVLLEDADALAAEIEAKLGGTLPEAS